MGGPVMARIRSIKPEFWTAEQIMELSPMARLLFIGMWNFCDDKGVHPVAYKTLKAEVFPADDLLVSDVERLVEELISGGLLAVFEANGRNWWYVTGWHHQVINRPSKSRFPEPPRNAPLPSAAGHGDDDFDGLCSDESRTAHGATTDDSLSTHGVLTDGVGVGVGRERKGVNRSSVVAGSGEPTPLPPATAEQPAPTRKGHVCGLLRKAGMSDSAPHYLTDETWERILARRTDEEIVEVAKAKMASRPGQRTGLKYIAPALLQDPDPIASPRASPTPGRRRQTDADEREAVSIALTGRTPTNERTNHNSERDITAECQRIA